MTGNLASNHAYAVSGQAGYGTDAGQGSVCVDAVRRDRVVVAVENVEEGAVVGDVQVDRTASGGSAVSVTDQSKSSVGVYVVDRNAVGTGVGDVGERCVAGNFNPASAGLVVGYRAGDGADGSVDTNVVRRNGACARVSAGGIGDDQFALESSCRRCDLRLPGSSRTEVASHSC